MRGYQPGGGVGKVGEGRVLQLCGSGSPQSKHWRKGNPAEDATGALGVSDESGDGATTMTRTATAGRLEERERLAKKGRSRFREFGRQLSFVRSG